MLKAVLIIGFVASCGFLGAIKAWELKERIVLLEDFRKMLLQIKGRMNYFREPLTTMADDNGKKHDSRAFKLFNEAGTALTEKNAEMNEIWAQEAAKIYKGAYLTADDMELIKYPGSFLGQTDWENHQARFDFLEKRLQEQLDDARNAYTVKGPLYRKIGFFAGGLVSIIFI